MADAVYNFHFDASTGGFVDGIQKATKAVEDYEDAIQTVADAEEKEAEKRRKIEEERLFWEKQRAKFTDKTDVKVETIDYDKIVENANDKLYQQLAIREKLKALMAQGLSYEEAVAQLREKYTQKTTQEAEQREESATQEMDFASQLEAVYSRAFEQKAEKEKKAADEAEKFKEQQEKARAAAEKLKEALTKVGSAIASAVKHAAKFAGHLAAAGSKGILNTLTFGLFKARKEATLLSKALQLAGVAGIGALFKNASSAANDLTDSVGLVNSTFGESAEGLHKWADETALYFHMSRLEAEKYFGKLGEYMRSAGLGTDASALMAKNLTARAGEMSRAFAGMSSEEATEQLYKVLSSERPKSAGAKIGLNLSQDALEAELLAEGIDRTYKSLSDAEKVVIKYNATMRQLSNITGSTADGFDSWEGAVANLTANAKDALSSLGLIIQHYLLPVVQLLNQVMSAIAQSLRGLLGTLGIELPTAATDAADSFDDMGDSAEDAGDKASKSLLPIDKLTVLSDSKGSSGGGKSTAGEDIEGLIKPLDWLKDGMKKPMKSLQELLDILKKADWSKAGKKVAEVFNKIVKKISEFAKKLGEFDLGKKLADFVNGLTKDLDTKSLGDLFGTLFGNAQDTITSFLTNLNAQNIGQKLADLIIGFDLPKNLGKLGTNFSLLLNKIGETINGFLGGAKGAEVRKDIKDGIKNMLSNAISGINASELGEAIGNIAKTLGSALLGAAEGVDGLGKKLADVVNEAIATGGISDLAEGLANFLISALVEGVKFIASTDWLGLAAEILKGIGKGIKDAVLDDPLVVAGALATIFAYSSLKKYLGLDALGKSICEDLGSGITANKGLVVAAAAGLATAVVASLKNLKDYIQSIIDLEKDAYARQAEIDNYQGAFQQGAFDKSKEELEKYGAKAGSTFDTIVEKYNNLSTRLSEKGMGLRDSDISDFNLIVEDLKKMQDYLEKAGADDGGVAKLRESLQKIKEIDLTEGWLFGSSESDRINAFNTLGDAVLGANESIIDLNTTIAEKNEALFKSTKGIVDDSEKFTDNAKKSTDELADAISKVAETDLPKFKENLEQTKQPMDDYLERAGKITELKYDGQLVDNNALQTNLDTAVAKVQQAAKDIDAAIANSTNLRNFEAVLDSTQTIKVDQSGTMNFKFDVTTKPDKDAFNKWQENYTYNNKKTVG